MEICNGRWFEFSNSSIRSVLLWHRRHGNNRPLDGNVKEPAILCPRRVVLKFFNDSLSTRGIQSIDIPWDRPWHHRRKTYVNLVGPVMLRHPLGLDWEWEMFHIGYGTGPLSGKPEKYLISIWHAYCWISTTKYKISQIHPRT